MTQKTKAAYKAVNLYRARRIVRLAKTADVEERGYWGGLRIGQTRGKRIF